MDGYVDKFNDWNRLVAAQIANKENIFLTPAHWRIIEYLREFYKNNNRIPSSYSLCMDLNTDIYKFFPGGYTRQLLKIAGIPKPDGCIS